MSQPPSAMRTRVACHLHLLPAYTRAEPVRILLVERDQAMVRVLERSLRSHGFDVSSASNEKDALMLAEDESVGMLVFDISPFTDVQWGTLQQLRASRPSL